jgi:hypothetical protein
MRAIFNKQELEFLTQEKERLCIKATRSVPNVNLIDSEVYPITHNQKSKFLPQSKGREHIQYVGKGFFPYEYTLAHLREKEKEESIKLFIEDQAFSPTYDLAPPLSPSPLSLSGAGGWGGANSYDCGKAWSSTAIQYSMVKEF